MAPPREDLLALARAGDGASIAQLLRHVQPDVRRYARRACRADDVDDAAQEALLAASRHLGTLRSAAALARWLFVVVARACRRLGRQGLRAWAPLDAAEAALALRPDPELRHDLAMAIQSLAPQHRSLLIRRDLEERTIDEIAALEGLTREEVKGRLRRARALLREYLA